MIWPMENDAFYVETLQKCTHYNLLVRKVPDDVFLDELAEELSHITRTYIVTRSSLIYTLGGIVKKRNKAVEEALRKIAGDKFDWKVVAAGVDYETAGPLALFMACLLSPLPVLWIRIAI